MILQERTKELILANPLLPSYSHVFDGLLRVVREEGFGRLYSGAQWAVGRCVFVTIGQLPFYDVVKQGGHSTESKTARNGTDTKHCMQRVGRVVMDYLF